MIKSLLQRYSLKLMFALSLLIGLQLPHFLNLYEIRLDAHYLESTAQLKQYQKIADFLFAGDLNGLVEKHKNSDIALFKAETEIIEALISSAEFLQAQKNSLQGTIIQRFAFLFSQIHQPLFIETQQNYQANIVLNQEAMTIGLIVATLSTLLLEMLFLIFPFFIKKTKLSAW